VADVNGNLYVTDSHNRSVRRIDAVTQAVSTIVATDLDNPWGITIDNAVPQNLYVTDIGTHSVKKLTETAVGSGVWNVSVFAGNGVIGTASSTPVIGNAARFNSPVGITIDHTYTYLYVADSGNNAIRRIKLANAEVEVIAGVGTAGNADNATGTSATFSTPLAITYAFYNATAEGVLFVTDQSGTTIRQVSTSAPYGVTSFGLN
jgi:YVTN family beta-propeller protein